MSSLHDMAILSVLNKMSILIDKLNKLADDELAKRGVGQEDEQQHTPAAGGGILS